MVRSLCAKMFWNQNLQNSEAIQIDWDLPITSSSPNKVLETPKLLPKGNFTTLSNRFRIVWPPHFCLPIRTGSIGHRVWWSLGQQRFRHLNSSKEAQKLIWGQQVESLKGLVSRYFRLFSEYFLVFSPHNPKGWKLSRYMFHGVTSQVSKSSTTMTTTGWQALQNTNSHWCCSGAFDNHFGSELCCVFDEAMASAGSQSSSKLQPVHSACWMFCILSHVSSQHHLK